MSQLPCDVIRDLMPLAAENVASAQSQSMVEEHVAACPDCQALFEEIRRSPPVRPAPTQADLTFSRAFGQMVKTIRRKYVMWALAGMLAAVLLIGAGSYAYDFLLVYADTPVPLSWTDVELSQMSQGYVLTTVRARDGHRWHAMSTSWEDEGGIVYFQFLKPVIDILPDSGAPATNMITTDLRMKDGVLYQGGWMPIEGEEDTEAWQSCAWPVQEVRLGSPQEYTVLYAAGGELPLCDKDTERRYLRQITPDGEVWYGKS